MTKRKEKILVLSILVLFIVFISYSNNIAENELEKYRAETTGTITGFSFIYKTTYKIDYKYTVNDTIYYGQQKTSYFECEDGTKGCIGKKIKVIYSTKTPKLSRVDLGAYNKYKLKELKITL